MKIKNLCLAIIVWVVVTLAIQHTFMSLGSFYLSLGASVSSALLFFILLSIDAMNEREEIKTIIREEIKSGLEGKNK